MSTESAKYAACVRIKSLKKLFFMDLKSILEYRLLEFDQYILTVATILGVVLVYVLTWIILRFLKRMIGGGSLLRSTWDTGRRHSLFLLVRYVIWLLAITAMLEVIGIHVTVLLAGSAALLVGLGLGVQQIFKDIVSGIFLLFEGTIEVGEVIQVDNIVGKVHEINLRSTKLLTREGSMMLVPNHKFVTENLLNWSDDTNYPTRFHLTLILDKENNASIVGAELLAVASKFEDIVQKNDKFPIEARLIDFKHGGIVFELGFWTLRKFEVEYLKSELRVAIDQRFKEKNIKLHYGT
jgi:small-conductance mechanosensitive channel